MKWFRKKPPILKFVFLDNAILLTMETINRNGYEKIWEQSSGRTKQIICFNEQKNDFQAFDKYVWSNEDNAIKKEGTGKYSTDIDNTDKFDFDVNWELKAVDLWTPIKIKYTNEWFNCVLRR